MPPHLDALTAPTVSFIVVTAPPRPPGPSSVETMRIAAMVRRGSLDAFEDLRDRYGSITYLPWPINAYVLFDPQAIAYVLSENHRNYEKSPNYREIAFVMGRGLVTSEGEEWVAQRRRVAAVFRADALTVYAEHVAATAHEWSRELRRRYEDGRSFDLTRELSVLTAALSCSFLFGEANLGDARGLRDWIEATSAAAIARIYAVARLPRWVPTHHHRAERDARRELYAFVQERLHHTRNARPDSSARRSLLSALLEPDEHGNVLSERELRDHMVTFLLAGQDTIESALSWFFYIVASRPELQARIRADSAANVHGLGQLTRACLLESMRLYPPVPLIGRCPLADDTIGVYTIPAGAIVVCAIRATQRDPAHWPDPLSFRPERFENIAGTKATTETAKAGAFPFGFGPRRCIGEKLAMIEMGLVTHELLAVAELRLEPGFTPVAKTTIVMKPRDGTRVSLMAQQPSV